MMSAEGFLELAYASPATPSNADYRDTDKNQESGVEDWLPEDYEDDTIEELEEHGIDTNQLSLVYDYFIQRFFDDFVGPGANPGLAENEDEDMEIPVLVESDISLDSPVPFAIDSTDSISNALRYRVRISGRDYVLLLSPDYINQVFIDSDGYLWNMGTSNIQGRLFEGSFNPTASTGTLLYLGPCLGNNFSANYNYGSPNYMRRYYWSSGRLTYSDTYVTVQVEESGFSFRSGDILTYVIIILLGGMLLCLWKKSVR